LERALNETGLPEKVWNLTEPSIEDMGFQIVRIQITGEQNKLLQVMVEHKDAREMVVNDCAVVSRAIAVVLDAHDPIKGAYTLEVSSPGIDRPLVRCDDYRRFAGFEAKVEMDCLIEGQKKFRGRLIGIDNELVRMKIDEQEVSLPFSDIRRAKLVITDDLIAAGQAGQTKTPPQGKK
jgi:ribosome maturation factor RimP